MKNANEKDPFINRTGNSNGKQAVFCNSFFSQNYRGLSVLLLVPHPDDEILTAGALVSTLAESGARITLVYTTNGDWKVPAELRAKEAVDSARLLGIPKENIIFLGYADSYNSKKRDHLFYADSEPARSKAGRTETYAAAGFADYAFLTTGKHHAYTRDSFLSDLVSVILNTRADLIVCTDFDEHPDHRMLSLCCDKAIGIVRKKEPDYSPEIWKRFAYSLAYTAVPDYTVVNNPETRRPTRTGKTRRDLVDSSVYLWKDRVRIPLSYSGKKDIRHHYLAKALLRHKSQFIITHADRIINSDEVYWRRRSESIAFSASVSTSSGDGSCLTDFMLYSVRDVDSRTPEFVDYFWKPDPLDPLKTAYLKWDHPQHVEQIILYGAIDEGSEIKELTVTLSDGYTVTLQNIPKNGNPVSVNTGKHDGITGCTIQIISSEGVNAGLSEAEIYSSLTGPGRIHPFCKILIDDNFAYEYLIEEETRTLPVSVYSFGEAEPNPPTVLKGKSVIKGNELVLDREDREIVIRAENREQTIWDQITITRLPRKKLEKKQKRDSRDQKYLERQRKRRKLHNVYHFLKNKGPDFVMKRLSDFLTASHFIQKR